MIIFNTLKAAEHYVKWCNKTKDYQKNGYDWETSSTYINGKYVVVNLSGDGCGCGCDTSLYNFTTIIGKIKQWDAKTIRGGKINKVLSK